MATIQNTLSASPHNVSPAYEWAGHRTQSAQSAQTLKRCIAFPTNCVALLAQMSHARFSKLAATCVTQCPSSLPQSADGVHHARLLAQGKEVKIFLAQRSSYTPRGIDFSFLSSYQQQQTTACLVDSDAIWKWAHPLRSDVDRFH